MRLCYRARDPTAFREDIQHQAGFAPGTTMQNERCQPSIIRVVFQVYQVRCRTFSAESLTKVSSRGLTVCCRLAPRKPWCQNSEIVNVIEALRNALVVGSRI